MGREARCICRWPGGDGPVKALLESQEVVVRGALRLTLPTKTLTQVDVVGETLLLTSENGFIELQLGRAEAEKWAQKLAEPPRTLKDKLGVNPATQLLLINDIQDPVLLNELSGVRASDGGGVTLCLACVESADDLTEAIRIHASIASEIPIWIVHRKGAKAAFGENAVRDRMRAAGYIDSKSAAISEEVSGTRYAIRMKNGPQASAA